MRIILPLVFTLFSLHVLAQDNLSGSIQHSHYTYIYKINKEEALNIINSNSQKIDDKYLHTRIDSFITLTDPPKLADGNYLYIYAKKNELVYELHTIGEVHTKLISDDGEVSLLLHRTNGEILADASVFLDHQQLSFHPATQTYGPARRNKGLLKVVHQEVLYIFPVTQGDQYREPFFKRIAYNSPLKYIVSPVNKWLKRENRYYEFWRKNRHEEKFRSFFVFNKPKFKPGDTVHLKAFIQTKNGRHLNKPLILRLSDEYYYMDTILTTLDPYRAGGYEYSFVLSDSLDLDLDEQYLVTLEETGKFTLGDIPADVDEDEYAAKRKVVARGKFYFEEYELKSVSFSARSDKEKHHKGEEVALFFSAKDENQLPVMDGRVNILVTVPETSVVEFEKPRVFLPDTLWTGSIMLDNLGETKMTIPLHIFPEASFKYRVTANFLNTNNELQSKILNQEYVNNPASIRFKTVMDTLEIGFQLSGKTVTADAVIYVLTGNKDTIEVLNSTLPARILINPFAHSYIVQTKTVKDNYYPGSGKVSAMATRTKDSVFVQMVNPQRLPVWYSIFAGNKLIHRGYSNTLSFADRVRTPKNYFVSLQYIYGNKLRKENYTIPFQDKLLTIKVKQPEFIYPGQVTDISINVSDKNGEPVEGADLTAYSFTSKFGASSPDIPYLGKYYKGRKSKPSFSIQENDQWQNTIRLNWERWSREFNLDTIAYYKFLHPGDIYINTEPVKDSVTQLAPFVVKNGELLPIHMIYIDEKPVYFSQAQHLHRYSFRVSPGKHSLRLRTSKSLIRIDNINIAKGVKTFISIEADTSNKKIQMQVMPDTLTDRELNLWLKYFIVIRNNHDEKFTYIKQGQDLFLLNTGKDYHRKPYFFAGPLSANHAELVVKNDYSQDFFVEGGWDFEISKGLIKQREAKYIYYLASRFNHLPQVNFNDLVLTETEIDSLWRNFIDRRSSEIELFHFNTKNSRGNGRLHIQVSPVEKTENIFVKNIILFRYDDPDFIRVYRGKTTDMGFLEPGNYRILFLLKNDEYFLKDSIELRPNGINYYETGKISIRMKDSTSKAIANIIENHDGKYSGAYELDQIKHKFNDRFFDTTSFSDLFRGRILDINGFPLPFMHVLIKGTNVGTTSGPDGTFMIRLPQRGVLIVSGIGFEPQEINNSDGLYRTIVMTRYSGSLDEVVVSGVTSTRRSTLTASSYSLNCFDRELPGKVPGLIIRGSGEVRSVTPPLIIVDGVIYWGSIGDIEGDEIKDVKVLTEADASALYGSRASGGAIIITTKKQVEPGAPGNSLRKNFRDYAYWQPKLLTDANGNASFRAIFPDDITNWNTYVIAASHKKQIGYHESSIRSFKNISGTIAMPQFLIAGDSINIIAKSLNYLSDSIKMKRSFFVNRKVMHENFIHLRHSWIDTFMVITEAKDSLQLKYIIEKADGLFDGEERSIPVFRPGVMETNGFFAALNKDTSFQLQMSSDTGTMKLYAEASMLEVLCRETENLKDYEYLCNEQLASKLKAMLVQKRIDQYLQRPFKEERNILQLIKKLDENKASSGLWGWWGNNDPYLWISLHVIEALVDAEKSGYKTSLKKELLIDYLLFNLENYRGTDKIFSLHLLQELNAKANFTKYIDTLEKDKSMTLYSKLRLLELKQNTGSSFEIDSFISKQQLTAIGNVYWGEESFSFFNNSIQNTILMYRILRKKGGHEDLLRRMRNYFLEKRRSGYWRNTYESSLILETILPDVLEENPDLRAPSITIHGKDSVQVKQFPFSMEIKRSDKISISKQGTMPVYFTVYQNQWNSSPEKLEGNFVVNSWFEYQGQVITNLNAGDPVLMKVKVKVKADADYVMIEMPVPAGCSYHNKSQSRANGEVHREYFKNKVSLFCTSLAKGEYIFSISLMPRYSGKYTLNPAKAEMMYFPVFNGREGLKKVIIN